jgi:hypothetical protein
VTAINGYDGNVVLDGSDIKISRTDSDSPTVAAVIAALQVSSEAQATAISTVESAVQSLDAGDIAYDRTGSTSTNVRQELDAVNDAIEDINLVRMFYSPSVSTDAPSGTDQLLVGTSSFPLQLTRRAFSDVLSAASIFGVTGGRVVKTTQVTLTRLPYEFNKAVPTSDNASIRIRRGMYSGEIGSFNIADIPIAIVSISGNAWMHYELPVFDRVAGSVTRLTVQVPFTQMYVSSGVTPAETITAQIAYLAAT